MDGVDIPVFYATGVDIINPCVDSNSEKKVYLVFIDINMYCSDSWRKYVNKIINSADKNTIVIAVKQYTIVR